MLLVLQSLSIDTRLCQSCYDAPSTAEGTSFHRHTRAARLSQHHEKDAWHPSARRGEPQGGPRWLWQLFLPEEKGREQWPSCHGQRPSSSYRPGRPRPAPVGAPAPTRQARADGQTSEAPISGELGRTLGFECQPNAAVCSGVLAKC